MKTTGFPRIRIGSRVRMVGMAVIGLLALETATNEANAGACDSGSSPRLACNGLEQTPDYKNLVSGQGTVTEDDLNGPWIETIKRVRQCAGTFRVTRAAIFFDEHDPGDEGEMSLSGPSLIRVPDDDFLGCLCEEADPTATKCYYLYYGAHDGEWIRLSYSQSLGGPWTPYRPGSDPNTGRGVLYRRDLEPGVTGGSYVRYCADHIASPNVQIRTDLDININLNGGAQEVDCNPGEPCYILYFHCKWKTSGGDQVTFATVSDDGKKFYHYDDAHAGNPYASLAQIFPGAPNSSLNDRWLHVSRRPNNGAPITMTANAAVTNAGLSDDEWIERGCEDSQNKTLCSGNSDKHLMSPSDNTKIHHVGITAREQYLYVFFHRKEYEEDRPMHLRVARIDMHLSFDSWKWDSYDDPDFNFAEDPRESFPVMTPVTDYERFNLEPIPETVLTPDR